MTNLGKYNEGQLAYERVAFPTDTETVQAALKKIGIDGIRYEEFFISDYDGSMPQLHKHLGEYESIDELNHLACVLSELDEDELAKFEAVMDGGEYTGSVKELINLAQNLDNFLYMLSQAAGDQKVLASHLGISPHQLSYVTHSGSGEGLLFYGDTTIPFVDHFPQDTELYTLLTTKPEDKANG